MSSLPENKCFITDFIIDVLHPVSRRCDSMILITNFFTLNYCDFALWSENYKDEIVNISSARKIFLKYFSNCINNYSFGMSMSYELHAERKQEALDSSFELFGFTLNEITWLKKECKYIECFSPYVTTCEDCDKTISSFDALKSSSFAQKDLCCGCLVSYY